jgi:hypothetical protein
VVSSALKFLVDGRLHLVDPDHCVVPQYGLDALLDIGDDLNAVEDPDDLLL